MDLPRQDFKFFYLEYHSFQAQANRMQIQGKQETLA
jgi:hypothetical protein